MEMKEFMSMVTNKNDTIFIWQDLQEILHQDADNIAIYVCHDQVKGGNWMSTK